MVQLWAGQQINLKTFHKQEHFLVEFLLNMKSCRIILLIGAKMYLRQQFRKMILFQRLLSNCGRAGLRNFGRKAIVTMDLLRFTDSDLKCIKTHTFMSLHKQSYSVVIFRQRNSQKLLKIAKIQSAECHSYKSLQPIQLVIKEVALHHWLITDVALQMKKVHEHSAQCQ